MGKVFSLLFDSLTSKITDQDIEVLQDRVKALNYELSLLRYKDSDDEDIRLAYEYLRKRLPLCADLFPYEKVREMPSVESHYDKARKMWYVMHKGRPLYFPRREDENLVSIFYRYAIEYDDNLGNGYRQRSPHAFQSERYHVEPGDVLIDAGGWTFLDRIDDSTDEMLDEALEVLKEDIVEKIKNKFSSDGPEAPLAEENKAKSIEKDVGTARGLLALDVIDKVSKVYLLERSERWWKPLQATFAPYQDKVELIKADLLGKKKLKKLKKKQKKQSIGLVDLLEKCGQQRVFVMMDLEGEELEVLRDAQEYLRTARNPITLAVSAYHRTTDYDNLKRFFESIGYHTETQPGYMYTDMNDGHGIHSLRRGVIRASNVAR